MDTLWAQLLLEFSTDHFETMRTCSTLSVDVSVIFRLSSHYFSSTFSTFFRLIFFQVQLLLLLEQIHCGRSSPYSFPPVILKLSILVLLFCVEVLRPSQPNGVMSSAVSLPNHTFTGQA